MHKSKMFSVPKKNGTVLPFVQSGESFVSFQLVSSPVSKMPNTLALLLLASGRRISEIALISKKSRDPSISRWDSVPTLKVGPHHLRWISNKDYIIGLLKWSHLWSARTMRWSLAAHDICFTRKFHSWFFSSGKCVPIVRGLGVYQEAMDFCLKRMAEGHWVHIFPEGKVNMGMQRLRLKWGVGRLIYDSFINPIVLPFYHVGMDSVLPNTKPYYPRVGKKVTVVVGEPMDFGEIVQEMRDRNEDPETARKIITDMIQEKLGSLRDKAEELHNKNLQMETGSRQDNNDNSIQENHVLRATNNEDIEKSQNKQEKNQQTFPPPL
ncbi:unnamed protein product, partial [Meganyctiphanes norvegica]